MQIRASQSNAKKKKMERRHFGPLYNKLHLRVSALLLRKSVSEKHRAKTSIRRWKCLLNAYYPLWGSPPVHTIASDSVSIFPRCVPPHRQCTPIGRKTSGSDPALLRSVFYSIGWHFSFFPSSPCVCVLFFNWCNEPMLCCRQRRGESLQQLKGPPHSSALLEHC